MGSLIDLSTGGATMSTHLQSMVGLEMVTILIRPGLGKATRPNLPWLQTYTIGVLSMTAQIMQHRELIAVFSSRNEADQAKRLVQASGLTGQQVFIDDQVAPGIQVAAQGTTTGAEAGFVMGIFLGGILGLIATIIIAFWLTGGYPDSAASKFVVVGSAIAGGIFGAIRGKALWARQPATQKMQSKAHQFRLIIAGSQADVRQAQQALGQPPVTS
jgi:hypothetical protein